jgi:NAD(P)H-dependent FMN reductase
MPATKNLLAINGSTRAASTNLNLLHAIQEMAAGQFVITIYDGLMQLPHFNPDDDVEPANEQVAAFRSQLREADGILICTPEYAMGVPGTLKNAIDWTVSSCEFSHKPTALITASSVGAKGHASLLETLKIIEAVIADDTQLLIPHAKTKISAAGKITDASAAAAVQQLLYALENRMQKTA